MAVPLTIPSSPSAVNSPTSTDGSNGPQTPVSPTTSVQTLALPPPVDGAPAPAAASAPALTNANATGVNAKRKPSRRANTAERRATHNAVERQRRETLNGRFLDLAALLPNLSQIRRPSKSSIVNSSIAHVHSSRRHRLLAARELRLLKLEADALRRELNEWRDRSGLPRVEEPVRGDGFQLVLSGEVEVLSGIPIEEEDAAGEYGNDDYGDDDYVGGRGSPPGPLGVGDEQDDVQMRAPMAQAAAASLLKNGPENPFAHTATGGGPSLHLQTMLPRSSSHPTPMIVQSPTGVAFENPAMAALYDHGPGHQLGQGPAPFGPQQFGDDKVWSQAQMFAMQQGIPLFTPPATSHGQAQVHPQQQAAFLMSLQRQQALLQQQQQQQQQRDDGSSAGSAAGAGVGRRQRSGSMNSVGSGYASGSSVGYEPRRGTSASWDDGLNVGMMGMGAGMGMGGMGMGLMKNTAISVGGGGNGHGYAAMML
ncbi:hypothetical protein BKA93DRAFT_455922 [Sparassis latifolia]